MNLNLAQHLRDNLKKRKQQIHRMQPQIIICGAQPLQGEVSIAGAKNAALPMMVASLLSDQPSRLLNVPNLTDVQILSDLLTALGANISHDQNSKTLDLNPQNILTHIAPLELVKKMRASFWIIAPLLARTKKAHVPLPGGDPIGKRNINIYIQGLKKLGAQIEETPQAILAHVPKNLKGDRFELPLPSVGATHVLIMAACLAHGETKLVNAAKEPEITALIHMLSQMGANIQGAGSSQILIQGSERLNGTTSLIPPDRIEAGTYAIAFAACPSSTPGIIKNAPVSELSALLQALQQAGINTKIQKNQISIQRPPNQKIYPVNIKTEPYPKFPTDLQAQWMTLMTQAQGQSSITETLFENRFQHAIELTKLGANISLKGRTATIDGPTPLFGQNITATDIRASASLVIAGLIAQGQTTIHNIYHLDRGFETIEHKLNLCGANIKRINV